MNFMSTGNVFTEIDFMRSKTTLVVGVNGQGKSTFIDALCFGLYNRPFRDINKPQLVNSITGKNALVEVELAANGHQYMIRRGIKPNKFEIYKNDQLVNLDAATGDYQTYLEREILKMSYKAFTQIVVLGSANYVPFMLLKDKERGQVIADLLDIGIFTTMNSLLGQKREEAGERMKEIVSDLKTAKSKLEVHNDYVASLQQDKQNLITALESKKNTLNDRINQLGDIRKEMESERDALSQKVDDQQAVENRSRSLIQIERTLEDKINAFRKDVHFFESNDSCPTCAQDIDPNFKHMTIEQYQGKITELDVALNDVGAKYQSTAERLGEIASILREITTITSRIGENTLSVHHHLQSISEIDSEIYALMQEKDDISAKDIKALEKQIKKLDKDHQGEIELKNLHELASVLLKDSGIKTRIIRKYIPVINKLINKYLSAMNFFINFNIDENFKEVIKSSFRDEFTYQSFSEGEKLRIDLAILFTWRAIAKMRNSMSTNLLIMDEILDSSLDNVGIDDFMTIIEEISGDTNIFVISHRETGYDKFHSVIKFEKHRNFSRIAAPVK